MADAASGGSVDDDDGHDGVDPPTSERMDRRQRRHPANQKKTAATSKHARSKGNRHVDFKSTAVDIDSNGSAEEMKPEIRYRPKLSIVRQQFRYRSLNLMPQGSQDEHDGGTTSSGPTSPRLSLDDGATDKRIQFHDNFQTIVKLNMDSKNKRNDSQELAMRGRRGSQVFFKGAPREKHLRGQLLWLHLRTYLSGRPMRSKQEILSSTQSYDEYLMRKRDQGKQSILLEIRNFIFTPTCYNVDPVSAKTNESSIADCRTKPVFDVGVEDSEASNTTADASSVAAERMTAEADQSMDAAYLDRQQDAVQQVAWLLHEFTKFERLFPGSEAMDALLQDEFDDELRERITVLYNWYNTTRGLCRKVKEVGHMLGMDRPVADEDVGDLWPHNDYSSPELSCSDSEEGGAIPAPKISQQFSSNVMRPMAYSVTSLPVDASLACPSPSSDTSSIQQQACKYRRFVERSLRLRGMRRILQRVGEVSVNTLTKARQTLERPHTDRPHASSYTVAPVSPIFPKRSLQRQPLTPEEYRTLSEPEGCPEATAVPGRTAKTVMAMPTPEAVLSFGSASGGDGSSKTITSSFTTSTTTTTGSGSFQRSSSVSGGPHLPSKRAPKLSKRSSTVGAGEPNLRKSSRNRLLLKQYARERVAEMTECGVYHTAFAEMSLPSYYPSFLFLLRIPLDLVHEWLRLRVEQKTQRKPDPLTLETLILDCHDCLEAAVEVKCFYQEYVRSTTFDEDCLDRLLVEDMRQFENDLCKMFTTYLDYVHLWGEAQADNEQTSTEWSQSLMQRLENEWKLAKKIAINILSGESDAAMRFCKLSEMMFRRMVIDHFDQRYQGAEDLMALTALDEDELSHSPHTPNAFGVPTATQRTDTGGGLFLQDISTPQSPSSATISTNHGKKDASIYRACREFKAILVDIRERALRSLAFAKLLSTDLEITAKFELCCSLDKLTAQLLSTDHVLVTTPHSIETFMMFCESALAGNEEHVQLLLNVTCGRDDHEVPNHLAGKAGYLLLVKCAKEDKKNWPGRRRHVIPDADTDMCLQFMHVDAVYVVVVNSKLLQSQVVAMRRHVPEQFLKLVDEQCSCHEIIAENMKQLNKCAMDVRKKIVERISDMSNYLLSYEEKDYDELDDNEKQSYRATIIQAYNTAFEYHRELAKLKSVETKPELAREMLNVAIQWTQFLKANCDKGHCYIPRWAHIGLNYLCLASDPEFTNHLTEEEFQKLMSTMNKAVNHVVGDRLSSGSGSGSASNASQGPFRYPLSVLDNGVPTRSTAGASRPNSTTAPQFLSPPLASPSSIRPSSDPGGNGTIQSADSCTSLPDSGMFSDPRGGIRRELQKCERQFEQKLLKERRIGRVVEAKVEALETLKGSRAPFRWQRLERKIGEGKFGQVYVAINLETGKLVAVKQMQFTRQDQRLMKAQIAEVENLKRVKHPNLVRYFGVEVHRDEIFIFMEYCNEGTLEKMLSCNEGALDRSSKIPLKSGLDEILVRKYTHFLLKGVLALHQHNILHRDIKPANIFLVNSNDVLKLGDFGSSVRLQRTQTIAGEITDYTGTPTYMAPEVCTAGKSQESGEHLGYGRPCDIWSVGCVVLQMATGKPPWHELDNHLQIIFKAGSGYCPTVPSALSDNCRDFLHKSFVWNPQQRARAEELLNHSFANITLTHYDSTERHLV